MRWSFVLALTSSILVSSCVGTEVGNPQEGESDVSVQFTGVEQPRPNALTLSSGVRIDEAWLVFSESSVELASECEEDAEIDVEQPFAVELIGGSELPTPNMFRRPQGTYCKFELGLEPVTAENLPEGAPAALAGRSVVLRGELADGRSFELFSAASDTIELRGEFRFEADRQSLLVAFALDRFFTEADLDGAAGDTTVIIDAENNTTILETVNENLPDSALLLRDANQDGAAQPGELAAPLADSSVEVEDTGS